MRYLYNEDATTYAAAVFPPGHTVTVQVLDLRSDALLSLTTANTAESPHIPGVYRWSFGNLSSTPTVKLDVMVIFTDTTTGRKRFGRYTFGGVPDIMVDNLATANAAIAALNDISVADILAAALTSGDTLNEALSRLDNIDTSVTTTIINAIAGVASDIAALNDISVSDILTTVLSGSGESVDAALSRLDDIKTDTGTTIPAAIAALNDISVSDILTAVLGSGESVDVALSRLDDIKTDTGTTIPAAIAALNDISAADVWGFTLGSGETADVAASRLDNIDSDVASVLVDTGTTIPGLIAALENISVADILAAVLTSTDTVDAALSRVRQLALLVEGGRDIDFTGNDALGWQRVERDTSGVELRRYNLFDEGGARITGTVAAFISASKMIASEVAL